MNIFSASRQFFLAAILILLPFVGSSQGRKADIIIKKDNSKLEVIIQEIEPNVIKYKKYTNPDGPLFSIQKSDVASIMYGNGEVESFNESDTGTNKMSAAADILLAPRNEFERDIRKHDANHLRDLLKVHNQKASRSIFGAVAFNLLSIGGLGGGPLVLFDSRDTYFFNEDRIFSKGQGMSEAQRDEIEKEFHIQNAIGIGMIISGATFTVLSVAKYIKFGKLKHREHTIRRELLRRNEPLSKLDIKPSYNMNTGTAQVALRIRF